MQLNSLRFFVFFAALFAVYWSLPHKRRRPLLFLASVLFYCGFGVKWLLLVLAASGFCLLAGRFLAQKPDKLLLGCAIVAGLLPLLFFKYFDFGAGLLSDALTFIGLPMSPVFLRLAQPVGISYYTFQMIGYFVDVYKGKQKPATDFFTCSLYLFFFPQILAGPLTRPRELEKQFDKPAVFSSPQAVAAGQLIVLGLFKKMFVADNLSYYTAKVFGETAILERFYGGSFLIATVLYSVQLYADFSGYTDMARGAAGLLGIELAENFETPYLSASMKEFWRRWHQSLSSWLVEYVYIPLGGSKVSRLRHYFNLMLTFFISGLWHGASIQMVLWGLLHGFYQVAGRITRPVRDAAFGLLHWRRESFSARAFSIGCTFCLAAFAWIFFAAPTPEKAFYIAGGLFKDFTFSLQYLKESLVLLGLSGAALWRQAGAVASMAALDLFCYNTTFPARLKKMPGGCAMILCWVLILAVMFFGAVGSGDFIYFKF